MDVNFKFNLDDVVLNMFGAEGVVTCLAFDDGGKQYSVKTGDGQSAWWKESQLSLKV